MEKDFLINLLLTLGVIICVTVMGGFLFLTFLSERLGHKYINANEKDDMNGLSHVTLTQKISNWYLSKGALPFWYIFGIDCLILVFCQMMAAYLVLGGQVLVPLFWDYFVLALCSLPFYYIGMKLFRSYETIVRFSTMEDFARIVCALFVGTIFVDVVKHFIPKDILPVYPLWQEQLIMLICAVLLMWSVRILVKLLFDNSDQSSNRVRSFIFGTSVQSIEIGLNMQSDNMRKGVIVAFVRANDKEPYTTIKGAELLNPQDNIVEAMVTNQVETLIVPYAAYPDFIDTHKDLVLKLLEKKITILMS